MSILPHASGWGDGTDRPRRRRARPFDRNALDNIPSKLRSIPQWVGWRAEDSSDGKKPPKVPVCPATGRKASVKNPSTWGPFKAAVTAVSRYRLNGVGLVITPGSGLVGIDLDDCREPHTGRLEAWAEEILDHFKGTYAEVSPSGTGVRIFAKGVLSPDRRCRAAGRGVEVYTADRYLTLTGRILPGRPKRVSPCPTGLSWIVEKYLRRPRSAPTDARPHTAADLADHEVIERARAAKNGPKFTRLFDGDWSAYPSQSEADLGLCRLLAFWCGRDGSQVDRLFRLSALMRPKWDKRRGRTTYGAITVGRAVAAQGPGFDPTGETRHPFGPSPARGEREEENTQACFKSESRSIPKRHLDRRLYALLSALRVRHARPVHCSSRRAAAHLGVSQSSACRAFDRLRTCGRIRLVIPGRYHGGGHSRAAVYDVPGTWESSAVAWKD